jgi:hypothetical protein
LGASGRPLNFTVRRQNLIWAVVVVVVAEASDGSAMGKELWPPISHDAALGFWY